MKTLKEYLAAIGAVGGAKSRRKLSKKEARRIAMVRWAAGAGMGAIKPCKQTDAGSATKIKFATRMKERAAALLDESKRSGDKRQRAKAFAIVKVANKIFMEAQK
jgi:hypothetical protein